MLSLLLWINGRRGQRTVLEVALPVVYSSTFPWHLQNSHWHGNKAAATDTGPLAGQLQAPEHAPPAWQSRQRGRQKEEGNSSDRRAQQSLWCSRRVRLTSGQSHHGCPDSPKSLYGSNDALATRASSTSLTKGSVASLGLGKMHARGGDAARASSLVQSYAVPRLSAMMLRAKLGRSIVSSTERWWNAATQGVQQGLWSFRTACLAAPKRERLRQCLNAAARHKQSCLQARMQWHTSLHFRSSAKASRGMRRVFTFRTDLQRRCSNPTRNSVPTEPCDLNAGLRCWNSCGIPQRAKGVKAQNGENEKCTFTLKNAAKNKIAKQNGKIKKTKPPLLRSQRVNGDSEERTVRY